MKTNGITYARAQNGIVLSILALLIGVPVLSQVHYALLKNTSFSRPDKKSSSAFQDYYAVLDPVERQVYAASVFFLTSSAGKNTNRAEEIIYSDNREVNNSLILKENNKPNTENIEISFKHTTFAYPSNSKADMGIAQYPDSQVILYAKVLKQYAKKHGFDTSYAFLSNMGMLCNKKRFFVVNLVTMEIEQSGLVSHGRGQGPSVFDRQYSNQSGSRCTSLGRYKILGKYRGGYGQAYKIVGLDSSNGNAYSRNIVLHSMGCIPDKEGLLPACVSEGCPAVSTTFLSSLSKIIDSRKKPVLLWIFDSNLEEAEIKKTNTGLIYATNKNHHCSIHPDDNLMIL
jgi:L,D-transpeptidase catalytic domain